MGKDTPSGHWELAGLKVPWDWHYFPKLQPSFPAEIVDAVCRASNVSGILGNCHASGTQIIDALAQQHVETGMPICYTSIDSVFQIAAHEEHFGLQRLYDLCANIAPTLHDMKVGRVIARPFVGDQDKGWVRTSNRRDYAIKPPKPVLMDYLQRVGVQTHAIGKIGDIFSMQGIADCVKGDDQSLMDAMTQAVRNAPDQSFTFANFVEFDSHFGHRRDVPGYARALEWFDQSISHVIAQLRSDDILILTADHGNDPTWVGTDHTRERVPVLIAGTKPKDAGLIGFADVAATIAKFFDAPYDAEGTSIV
jgi:phosphopentomutase